MEGLRNTEGGFFTAAATPDVGRRAVTGERPRAALRSFAALTDGATRWTELFRLGDWEKLLTVLKEEGARELIEQTRLAETADGACRAFPRGKRHDDASALHVEL
ncbi:hypothetical protein [Streptomyces prunicolor]|uniref:hypothetical protein n=1 Tax=Streptomyces prunicolor TaxID=67348 RepID=UPI003F4E0EB9